MAGLGVVQARAHRARASAAHGRMPAWLRFTTLAPACDGHDGGSDWARDAAEIHLHPERRFDAIVGKLNS